MMRTQNSLAKWPANIQYTTFLAILDDAKGDQQEKAKLAEEVREFMKGRDLGINVKMYMHLMTLLGWEKVDEILEEAQTEQEGRKRSFTCYDHELWNKYLWVKSGRGRKSKGAWRMMQEQFRLVKPVPPTTLKTLLDFVKKSKEIDQFNEEMKNLLDYVKRRGNGS